MVARVYVMVSSALVCLCFMLFFSRCPAAMYERTISALQHTERSLGSYLGTPKFIDAFTRAYLARDVVISPQGNFSYEATFKNQHLRRLMGDRSLRIMQRWKRTSPTTLKGTIQCERVVIEVDLEVFVVSSDNMSYRMMPYTALRVSAQPVRTGFFSTPEHVIRAAMDDFTDALETMFRPKGGFGVCARPGGPGCERDDFFLLFPLLTGRISSLDRE
jgi:hypothetical protein